MEAHGAVGQLREVCFQPRSLVRALRLHGGIAPQRVEQDDAVRLEEPCTAADADGMHIDVGGDLQIHDFEKVPTFGGRQLRRERRTAVVRDVRIRRFARAIGIAEREIARGCVRFFDRKEDGSAAEEKFIDDLPAARAAEVGRRTLFERRIFRLVHRAAHAREFVRFRLEQQILVHFRLRFDDGVIAGYEALAFDLHIVDLHEAVAPFAETEILFLFEGDEVMPLFQVNGNGHRFGIECLVRTPAALFAVHDRLGTYAVDVDALRTSGQVGHVCDRKAVFARCARCSEQKTVASPLPFICAVTL